MLLKTVKTTIELVRPDGARAVMTRNGDVHAIGAPLIMTEKVRHLPYFFNYLCSLYSLSLTLLHLTVLFVQRGQPDAPSFNLPTFPARLSHACSLDYRRQDKCAGKEKKKTGVRGYDESRARKTHKEH